MPGLWDLVSLALRLTWLNTLSSTLSGLAQIGLTRAGPAPSGLAQPASARLGLAWPDSALVGWKPSLLHPATLHPVRNRILKGGFILNWFYYRSGLPGAMWDCKLVSLGSRLSSGSARLVLGWPRLSPSWLSLCSACAWLSLAQPRSSWLTSGRPGLAALVSFKLGSAQLGPAQLSPAWL